MVFGKLWDMLARIEEHFFTAQMDWMSVTTGFYKSKIMGRGAERSGHKERSKLWRAVFTASDWESEEWEELERGQAKLYDEYAESIYTISKMLKELDYTDQQINGLLATLITNPEATTPEREETFVKNWFALTRQLPGMTDEGINSASQGRAIQATEKSLRAQIKIEVMRWLPTPDTEELRDYLIDLTTYNDKGETDANLLNVCGVTDSEEYLEPVVNSKSIYQEIEEVQAEKKKMKTRPVPVRAV